MLFGKERGDIRCTYLGGSLKGSTVKISFPGGKELAFELPLSGAHQAMNAAAAAAAAFAAGIPPETIAAGLAKTVLPGGRNRIFRSGNVTCIDDTYNANPVAVCAALRNLKEFADPEKLVLLLGEMRELGEAAPAAHQEVKQLADELFPGTRKIYVGSLYGDDALPDAAAAAEKVARILREGDLLFAKGSRGVGLEKALPVVDELL